jgi:septal ring factor EnvC (AmiA/AmiB activator)
MRRLQLMGVIGFLLVSTARAGPLQSSSQRAAAPSSSSTVHQRIARSQAEVKRLERDLARQESDSKRAGKRLQQQDQAIAELQKQLHELQAAPPAGQH